MHSASWQVTGGGALLQEMPRGAAGDCPRKAEGMWLCPCDPFWSHGVCSQSLM